MNFIDITHDTKDHYALRTKEEAVFFALNRTGHVVFELLGEGASAHIYAFHIGRGETTGTLTIEQKHIAPHTVSRASVKSALSDTAQFFYEGLVSIEKTAGKSDASQESRSLLLSKEAKAHAKPSLEILADDVACRHAATTSPINRDALFFAQSRGLSREQATKLLVDGFFQSDIARMQQLGVRTDAIQHSLESILATAYAQR